MRGLAAARSGVRGTGPSPSLCRGLPRVCGIKGAQARDGHRARAERAPLPSSKTLLLLLLLLLVGQRYVALRTTVGYLRAMSKKGKLVKVDWLQVPAEAVDQRAPQLAQLLTQGTGKRVSEGDALLLLVRLWQWVLTKVNPDAEDLTAEFAKASTVPEDRAAETVATACRWPVRRSEILLESLLDPEVRALVREGDCVRVDGLMERYTGLAERQRDNRGRATASKRAKEYGWTHKAGVGYVSPTGEVAESWRDLLARLGGAK